MNYFKFPYIPNPYEIMPGQTIEIELNRLKQEIKLLKERIRALEKKESNEYLEKDDGLYMI